TEVHQVFWATPAWVKLFAPLIKPFMHTFLGQDRDVVVKQREGLVHQPRLMLINDADTQARWRSAVKDEWIAARKEGRAVGHPTKAKLLRWRGERQTDMTDMARVEAELPPAIAAASDEAALETIRVAALGKSGSVSTLLRTLGSLTPDERKQ